MRHFVQLFQERNCFQILAPAKLVRHPLAFFAAVIEIEHRRDCIDAQPVEMKLIEPEQRVADQEIPHLVASEIENERAPILLFALPRIGMLVKIGTVKLGQSMSVLREMSRHPIHDDADPFLVKMIDQETKIVWRSIPRRRSEIRADLISP